MPEQASDADHSRRAAQPEVPQGGPVSAPVSAGSGTGDNPGAESPASPSPARRSHRALSSRKKLAFGLIVVCVLLASVEMVLAVVGVKPQYLEEDPLVGFGRGAPLFYRDGDVYRTNPNKLWFFNEQEFPFKKAANEYRVFCLGGSTTYGHPYTDGTSFSGWLRERLRDAAPDQKWQVINCGGISYASYRICHLMQELASYEPDLFVFYEGHNEFLEDRTYGDLKDRNAVARAGDWFVARTRTGTVLARIFGRRPLRKKALLPSEVDTILEHSIGPEKYHRDEKWRTEVIKHFHLSLDRACAIARNCGAGMILVKPSSNLRDFRPFKSESGTVDFATGMKVPRLLGSARKLRDSGRFADAAIDFTTAAELDPRHALTQWEAGDALFRSGDPASSARYFVQALDEDVCPLRACSEIQAAVEQAAQRNGVPLIDFVKLIEDDLEHTAGHRIPGNESFLDHVHPTIENNRRLAWALFDELTRQNVVTRPSSPENAETIVERVSRHVLSDLDPRKQAESLMRVAQTYLWAGKDEEALHLTERAEETFPGLCEVVSYRGRALQKLGRLDEARRCYEEAVRRDPKDSLALSRLARSHLLQNEYEAALRRYSEAIEEAPVLSPQSYRGDLHVGRGRALRGLNRRNDAISEFRRALEIDPKSASASAELEMAARNPASR